MRKLIVNLFSVFGSTILLLHLVVGPALAYVGAALVEPNSVVSESIVDRSVRARDLHADAVTRRKILNGAVTSTKILNGAVTADDIADGSITDDDIADGSITDDDLAESIDAESVDGFDADDFLEDSGDQTIDGTLTANGFTYGATQTGYQIIMGTDLQPRTSTYGFDKTGTGVYATSGGSVGFQAGVHLPQGATVTGLAYYAIDNSGTTDTTLGLYREALDGSIGTLASTSTAGLASSPTYQVAQDNTIDSATIDNSSYAYYLRATLDSGAGSAITARHVLITYQYSRPTD